MALSKTLSSITIKQNAASPSWTTDLTVQNADLELMPVFWNGQAFDELLDASLDQNLRGLRLKLVLTWNMSTESSTIRTFINNVVTDLTGTSSPENEGIRAFFDVSNYKVMVPDSFTYKTIWKNQIGRFTPSLSFISQEKLTSIDSFLEAP